MFHATSIADDLVIYMSEHAQRIKQQLYWPEAVPTSAPTPLHATIAMFVQIANGKIDRSSVDDQFVGELVERFQGMLDLLFLPATGQYSYRIPATFWTETAIGQMLAYVQAWLRHDDLISFTDAAQLLFPKLAQTNLHAARMRVRRLTDRGELMLYHAPDEPNPTQQARVSRQALEALRAAGRVEGES